MADQPTPEEVRNALVKVDIRNDVVTRDGDMLRTARVLAAECRRLASEVVELRAEPWDENS